MTTKSGKDNEILSLELAIEEQRRDFDAANTLYESARSKNYSLIALGLGLLGFLYGTSFGQSQSLKDKLFIPDEPYGVIIYGISAVLFATAMMLLIAALKSRAWNTAYDNEQDRALMNNYKKYLNYMSARYLRCSQTNTASLLRKQFLVDAAFWPLVIGGILLLVLKIFRG